MATFPVDFDPLKRVVADAQKQLNSTDITNLKIEEGVIKLGGAIDAMQTTFNNNQIKNQSEFNGLVVATQDAVNTLDGKIEEFKKLTNTDETEILDKVTRLTDLIQNSGELDLISIMDKTRDELNIRKTSEPIDVIFDSESGVKSVDISHLGITGGYSIALTPLAKSVAVFTGEKVDVNTVNIHGVDNEFFTGGQKPYNALKDTVGGVVQDEVDETRKVPLDLLVTYLRPALTDLVTKTDDTTEEVGGNA